MEIVRRLDVVAGYKERMRRLALFEPLLILDRAKVVDDVGKEVDMKGLGLLSLLFFFEQKLMRQYKVGKKHLASFLQEATEGQYVLTEEKALAVAQKIIETYRPTTGKKRSYTFFNWELLQDDAMEYSLLKTKGHDMQTNQQFYTLDEDGLELVFATKEFYSEFQLSINQLMLRKQLEKGEFIGALRQINEMHINVETLAERILHLKHEIQRNIVSEETFERYKELLEDTNTRLQREHEEFKELRQFVNETKERLFAKDVYQKEVKTYDLIITITSELEFVHTKHSQLLQQAQDLQNTALEMAQESLYASAVQAFNFEQDIVAQFISTPLPLEAMGPVLHPFLKVEENKQWSPFVLFEEQRMLNEQVEREATPYFETVVDDKDDPYKQKLARYYKEMMDVFLQAYACGKGSTLSDFFAFVRESGKEKWLESRYLYDFFLILHQRSPISNEKENSFVIQEAMELLGGSTIVLKEETSILHPHERFSIQEMTIQIEER